MENQHRKINGYRELSQEEIDLMNKIKKKGAELMALNAELCGRLSTDAEQKLYLARESLKKLDQDIGFRLDEYSGTTDECQEWRRFMAAEPQRWAAIGKTDIQTAIMAMVRAVAQPGDGV